MTDELLPYYQRELAFIRNLGAEFARANPSVAGHLRMSESQVEDPHVERLIEAFAYLNARTRHKIEDDFPEITEAFLSILYPHYLAPFPSCSVARFRLHPSQIDSTDGLELPRGAPLETHECRFRTCYPVRMWPLDVQEVEFRGFPAPLPALPDTPHWRAQLKATQSVLRLELQSFSPQVPLQSSAPDRLRFFLHGQEQHTFPLYEYLLNDLLVLVASTGEAGSRAITLDPAAIVPVGFEADQGLFDYGAHSSLGYRLLSEYFAFPQKFLFFEIQGLTEVWQQLPPGPRVAFHFLLRKHTEELERNVQRDSLQLGCTPIVNLFRHTADPLKVRHTLSEHRVISDPRRPHLYEIFSVDRVEAASPDGTRREFSPFYSLRHAAGHDEHPAYWHASRRRVGYRDGKVDPGTEVYLSLVDLNLRPADFNNWTVSAWTTCLNRDIPARIPFDGALPLQLSDGGAALEGNRAVALLAPTPTLRPARGHGNLWRLISHLSLNHLSLVDAADGALAMREILLLYDLRNSAQTRQMIEGLAHIASRRVVGRVAAEGGGHGVCRGVEVTLTLDEDSYGPGKAYLFAAVLDRFLGLHSSVNSFTRTRVRSPQREDYFCRWPARAGRRVLI